MRQEIIQVISAAIGTGAFALFFHVHLRHLPLAVVGGALSCACYLLMWEASANIFFSSLLASALICVWSEVTARLRKAPANVFLIPGVIPILPGSFLYYTMLAIVAKDMETFLARGLDTLQATFGIVVGIVIGSEIVRLALSAKAQVKRQAN